MPNQLSSSKGRRGLGGTRGQRPGAPHHSARCPTKQLPTRGQQGMRCMMDAVLLRRPHTHALGVGGEVGRSSLHASPSQCTDTPPAPCASCGLGRRTGRHGSSSARCICCGHSAARDGAGGRPRSSGRGPFARRAGTRIIRKAAAAPFHSCPTGPRHKTDALTCLVAGRQGRSSGKREHPGGARAAAARAAGAAPGMRARVKQATVHPCTHERMRPGSGARATRPAHHHLRRRHTRTHPVLGLHW